MCVCDVCVCDVCVCHKPLQSFEFQQVSATSRLPKGMQEGFSGVCVCVTQPFAKLQVPTSKRHQQAAQGHAGGLQYVCVSHNPLQSFEFQQVSATSRLPKGMQEGFSVCVCVCVCVTQPFAKC